MGARYYDSTKHFDWNKASYVSDRRGPCGVHNHADHIRTVGMADCALVTRTRLARVVVRRV